MSVVGKILIVSDLHLGGGGTYDIFAGGQELPSLLQNFAAPGHTVILNGDSVDFLMNEDPLELDEERAVRQAEVEVKKNGELYTHGQTRITRQEPNPCP
jgi:hypothetical protein